MFSNFFFPIADRFLKHEGYKFGVSPKGTKNQLSGKDGKISAIFEYDPKLNRYYPDDKKLILLELFSPGINNNPHHELGWFFTSTSDVIFWLWRAKPNKPYLLGSGCYLFLKNIRIWFLKHPENYKKYLIKKNRNPSLRKETGSQWETYNLMVPIQDFPNNCILEIKKTAFMTPIEECYFYKFFKNANEVNSK